MQGGLFWVVLAIFLVLVFAAARPSRCVEGRLMRVNGADVCIIEGD